MKVGDLVKNRPPVVGLEHRIGIVVKIDKDYYGASQAFKMTEVSRGKCIHPKMVNTIGKTSKGIRDRVLVVWPEDGWEYAESTDLVVVD